MTIACPSIAITDRIPDNTGNISIRANPLEQAALRQQLDSFLQSVERRALVMAEMAVQQREDALDLVQDSMLAFVSRYSKRRQDEWPPLFFRILQNRIRDFYRRSKVRYRWMAWLSNTDKEDEQDPIQTAPDPQSQTPEQLLSLDELSDTLLTAVNKLPPRQQQTLMLRQWEGLSVADTAKVMGCSQGSIKTHLSRALQSIKAQLEDTDHA